jgi:hypothetical protein
MVQIDTSIPKAQLFRFENYWVDQSGFMDVVSSVWSSEVHATSSVTRVGAKKKLLRRVLKRWAMGLSKLKEQIKCCNYVLAVMDKIEENRFLVVQERNFRRILKKHILMLLKAQKEYWRKRYTVRSSKLGDESTKFFHAVATKRFRFNTITSLDTLDGRLLSSHAEKAAHLWDEYKNILGSSVQPTMRFNLQELVQSHDLQSIAEPFSKEDIDKVISAMPNDKPPGPDGFNGLFLKKCWHIIKEDFYKLCFDFLMV